MKIFYSESEIINKFPNLKLLEVQVRPSYLPKLVPLPPPSTNLATQLNPLKNH